MNPMRQMGQWRFDCDVEATRSAYARAGKGGVDTCSCNGCRNFVLAREAAFPAPFVAFLKELGVDPNKDGEVYHTGRWAPHQHLYGGWFHFVGKLHETGDFPPVEMGEGFTVHLGEASAPALEALKGLELVEISFDARTVPWMLDEWEPD